MMAKLSAIDDLKARVAELELIVLEQRKRRPPSRLGMTFRYLAENVDTLRDIVEDHKDKSRESQGG
jgi:hypothetical protein